MLSSLTPSLVTLYFRLHNTSVQFLLFRSLPRCQCFFNKNFLLSSIFPVLGSNRSLSLVAFFLSQQNLHLEFCFSHSRAVFSPASKSPITSSKTSSYLTSAKLLRSAAFVLEFLSIFLSKRRKTSSSLTLPPSAKPAVEAKASWAQNFTIVICHVPKSLLRPVALSPRRLQRLQGFPVSALLLNQRSNASNIGDLYSNVSFA